MPERSLTVGARAPDFLVPITSGTAAERGQGTLDSYADRWLILVFYSRDFSLL
jgi:peroxiredoxin